MLVHSAHSSGDYSSIQPCNTAAVPIRTSPGTRRSQQVLLSWKLASLGEQGFSHHNCLVCTQTGCRLWPWGESSECQQAVSHLAPLVFARPGWGSLEMPVHFQRLVNHCVYTSFSSADPCFTAMMGFTVN